MFLVVGDCNACQLKAEETYGVGSACRVDRSACHGKNGGLRDMYAANGWFFLHCSPDGPWCKPYTTEVLFSMPDVNNVSQHVMENALDQVNRKIFVFVYEFLDCTVVYIVECIVHGC